MDDARLPRLIRNRKVSIAFLHQTMLGRLAARFGVASIVASAMRLTF